MTSSATCAFRGGATRTELRGFSLSIALIVSLIFVSACNCLGAVQTAVVFRPAPGGPYQLYVPASGASMTLTGTEKMADAVVGDVDGDGLQDDIVYHNSLTGGLGYYRIPADGTYLAQNDHAIPGVPGDSIPLTVLRTSASGSPGIIIFKSQAAGTSGALLPSGAGLTDIGWMERAYAVDLTGQGFKGNLLWARDSSAIFWRDYVTGTDHQSPFGGAVLLGSGNIISGSPQRRAIFLSSTTGTICAADQNWSYTPVDGTAWSWLTNLGSSVYGDIDGDGAAEILFVRSSSDPLQCYKPPSAGGPYDPAGLSTDPSIWPGWALHGVAVLDVDSSGPIGVTRISSLASLPNGAAVQMTGKTRTQLVIERDSSGKPLVKGYYLQESDRSSGIWVTGQTAAAEGQSLTVKGTLNTLNGERTITPSEEALSQSVTTPRPLSTTIKSLWSGLAMTGLLVRLAGTIVNASPSTGTFYLNDGSKQTLKVYCHDFTQTSGPCTVTGCVGAELGSGGSKAPVLRLESAAKGMQALDQKGRVSYFAWTQSSAAKVAKTDPVQPMQTRAVNAARNEHEAFQIVLRGDKQAVKGVTLTKSNLTGTAGTISASNVSLYLPYYIWLPSYSRDVTDPLPAYKAPFDLQPGQTQPVWVDVYVPRTTPAGLYNGTVTITSSNGVTTDVKYTLRVYNFTLPDESKLQTLFDYDNYYMAPKEGVTYGTAACTELGKQYYEFLLARGISTSSVPGGDFNSAETAAYLKDPRRTTICIPYHPTASVQKSYFDQVKACGVWDKAYVDCADEIYTKDNYDLYKSKANYYHSIDPTVRTMCTYYVANPPWAAPQHITDILAGYARIWCPILGDAFEADRLAVRRAAGDRIWTYICTNPDGISPNFFLQDPAMSHRIIAWQCYLHQATGWLYWHSNFWRDVSDPWTDACTGKGIDGRLYGEGSLLYPGKIHTGTAGPVSSVRLEVFRDSLDDYKYFWLLEQKIGRTATLAYVQQMATDWKVYSKDVTKLESVRDSIAQRIQN